MRVAYVRGEASEPEIQNAITELENAGCDRVVVDSTPRHRPESAAALTGFLSRMKPGDSLIVTTLDQLGRTTPRLLERLADLVERGIAVKTLSGEMDTAAPGIADSIKVLWAFESRQRNGRKPRSPNAVASGRPRRLTGNEIRKAREMIEVSGRAVADVARELGVSRATLYRSLKRGSSE